MVDSSKEKRAPAALKVKYKSGSIEAFIGQAGMNISRGGIFIRTKKPMSPGTPLKFEFQLSDATPVIRGVGQVAWCREKEEDKDNPAGMGVKFLKLDASGRSLVERIVQERGVDRSRFDKSTEVEKAPVEAAAPSQDTESTREFEKPVEETDKGEKQTKAAKKSQQIGHVGEFLASALRDSSVKPEVKEEEKTEEIPLIPISEPTPAEAFEETDKGDIKESSEQESQPSPLQPEPERPASTLEDELFGDLETQIAAPPVLYPEMLSKPPQPPPDVQKPQPFKFDKLPLGDSADLDDELDKVTEDRSIAGLFSEPVPADEEETDEKTLDLSELGKKVTQNDEALLAEEQEPIDISSIASSSEEQEIQPSLPATYSPLPPSLSAAPPLDAAPPLSISPSLAAKKPSGIGRIVMIGLAVCLVLGIIAGGAVFLLAGKKRPDTITVTKVDTEIKPAAEPTGEDTVQEEEAEPAVSDQMEATAEEEPESEPEKVEEPVELTKVTVTSVPRDAQITIDDEQVGTTPARLELAVGKAINITVKSPKYSAMSKKITIEKRMAPIRFRLEPMDYIIVVKTIPPGATVRARGITAESPQPIVLGPIWGMVSVAISKSGFRRRVLPVRIDQFEEIDGAMRESIAVKLIPLPDRTHAAQAMLKDEGPSKPAEAAAQKPKEAVKPSAAETPVTKPKEAAAPADTAKESKVRQNPYQPTAKPAVTKKKEDEALPDNPF